MTDDLFNAILAATDAVHDAAVVVGRVADRLETPPRLIPPNKKPAQPFTVVGFRPALAYPAFGSTDK